jgi:hypothetical protein
LTYKRVGSDASGVESVASEIEDEAAEDEAVLLSSISSIPWVL